MFIDSGRASMMAPFEGAEDKQAFITRETFRSFERSQWRIAARSVNISPLTG